MWKLIKQYFQIKRLKYFILKSSANGRKTLSDILIELIIKLQQQLSKICIILFDEALKMRHIHPANFKQSKKSNLNLNSLF
jgi:hypothetical protein